MGESTGATRAEVDQALRERLLGAAAMGERAGAVGAGRRRRPAIEALRARHMNEAERLGREALSQVRTRTRQAVIACLEAVRLEQGRAGSALRTLQLQSTRKALEHALTEAATRRAYFKALEQAREVMARGNYPGIGAKIGAIIDAHERGNAPEEAT